MYPPAKKRKTSDLEYIKDIGLDNKYCIIKWHPEVCGLVYSIINRYKIIGSFFGIIDKNKYQQIRPLSDSHNNNFHKQARVVFCGSYSQCLEVYSRKLSNISKDES